MEKIKLNMFENILTKSFFPKKLFKNLCYKIVVFKQKSLQTSTHIKNYRLRIQELVIYAAL